MFRYRSTQLASLSARFPSKCPFCHLDDPKLNPKPRRIIKETKYAIVLDAMYPYDIWEFRNVTDHLMIIPKRHVSSLSELSAAECKDIMNLFGEYEAKGYNVYARATDSVQRTIPLHQHTHLLKTTNRKARGGLYLEKPYFMRTF